MLLIATCSIIALAYCAAQGKGVASVICSYAVVIILALLFPSLRGFPVPAYVIAWAWVWAGIQFALPWALGRSVAWRFQSSRLALAVVIA